MKNMSERSKSLCDRARKILLDKPCKLSELANMLGVPYLHCKWIINSLTYSDYLSESDNGILRIEKY